jgi:hypothetical protein
LAFQTFEHLACELDFHLPCEERSQDQVKNRASAEP